MNKIITEHKKEVTKIFKAHKIEKAFLFGSINTKEFHAKSDIDFLILFKKNIPPLEKGELWWNLHDKLRNLFNREIDLVTESSLKNPYFIKEINNTKELIYG